MRHARARCKSPMKVQQATVGRGSALALLRLAAAVLLAVALPAAAQFVLRHVHGMSFTPDGKALVIPRLKFLYAPSEFAFA